LWLGEDGHDDDDEEDGHEDDDDEQLLRLEQLGDPHDLPLTITTAAIIRPNETSSRAKHNQSPQEDIGFFGR
jgi:hypothetical protein